MDGKTPRETEQYRTDGGMHARLAQGLRDAARYIETHPDLPIPLTAEIHYCIPAPDDKAGDDEAYRIAAMLGTPVEGGDVTSEAALAFGPAVSYRAVYVNRGHMAAYREHMAAFTTPGSPSEDAPELAVAV